MQGSLVPKPVMQIKVALFPGLLRSLVFGSDMSAPSIMTIVCIRSLHGRLSMYKNGTDVHVLYRKSTVTAIPLSLGAFVAS